MLSPLLDIVSKAEAREPRVFCSLEDEEDDVDGLGRFNDNGNIFSAVVFLLRFRSAIFRDGGIGIGIGTGRISFEDPSNGVCNWFSSDEDPMNCWEIESDVDD